MSNSHRRLIQLFFLFLPIWAFAETPAIEAQPLKLLMVLWRGETDAEHGFLDQLQKQRVAIDVTMINAKQDRNTLAEQLWQLAPKIDQFDIVYSFGTTASVMAKTIIQGRLPQLYNIVSYPAEAELLPASADSLPLTGATDTIPARLQLNVARQLFEIKSIGFLFNSREQNSRVHLEELEQLCAEMGITLKILRVAPNSESLANQLKRLQSAEIAVDTLYLPSDSYIISQSTLIMEALRQTPYKIIGANEIFVRDGALLAVAPDYEAIGRDLARRLIELQANGFRSHLEPITVKQPRIIYNETTLKRLQIQIPLELAGKMISVR
tara:strand:- start:95 stop:1066 length:972 start_codon:yes stop_codon:yes gene_type:complete